MISGTMNSIPSPGTVEATLKLAKPYFVVIALTQTNLLLSSLTIQSYWLCSGDHRLSQPTSPLECHWAARLAEVVTSSSGQMGLEDILQSG